MKWRIMLVVSLSLIFVSHSLDAKDRIFSVVFNVPLENELTDMVRSFVTRELRELPDVKLVEKIKHGTGQYFISVVPQQVKLTGGRVVGVVVSFVIQDGDNIMHDVLIGPSDNLKGLCEKVVSIFDVRALEPYRKK
jgi:hypothetical protein